MSAKPVLIYSMTMIVIALVAFAIAIAIGFKAFPTHGGTGSDRFGATGGGGSGGSGNGGGKWLLVQQNIGIVAMHMQLMQNDRVVIFDRTDFGHSNLTLPNGRCRTNPYEKIVKVDCTAHSVEYDVASNTFRALFVQTDVWCSSGSVAPNGRLMQTGGYNDGERALRIFNPCPTCDWEEFGPGLAARRWYATNHILPDGRQIIIGGKGQFNYEFYPKATTGTDKTLFTLPFLLETYDPAGVMNNLYPFVFLNVDGNLFIFANSRSILFDYNNNKVVKTYPEIPGGDPRCYPSAGSAVLLPLNLQAPSIEAEVLVCGGAPRGSFEQTIQQKFLETLDTCGRMKITDPNPQWVMEKMPRGRVMGDMVTLPNGNVLIINGAALGTAAWEAAREPVLNPLLYKTNNPAESRFELQNPSKIPRLYHSTAVLLRDGRILVGGSNPHIYYNFTNVLFPTELRLEIFSPSYLDPHYSSLRPNIIAPSSKTQLKYDQKFQLQFQVTGKLDQHLVSVTLFAPPFNTHSFSMNQRLLVLPTDKLKELEKSTYQLEVTTPKSTILAPPGFYLLFVVHQEIPSEGIWAQIL